ncbi:MAG: ADP-glyceromanno-heptose 6-epimerase [Chitinophagaceae bacterium]|jgi:ADP-L-glycero-D-manno-heptose 6-epimerase
MQQNDTIAITGAAGFIASCLVAQLNKDGFTNLILVDDFSDEKKSANLVHKKFEGKIHRDQFIQWLRQHPHKVQHIFHLGARTDTTEMDYNVHRILNLEYSKDLWEVCVEQNIPLVYASSAATYGNGEFGYKDDNNLSEKLVPLNPYGVSKNEFDIWALQQKKTPPHWAGVKFFNVYGPNEYHKGRMASVIFHAYNQIKDNGAVTLFRSHHPDFKDGEQLRDFIFVQDIINIIVWLMNHKPENGLYNAGTGKARTFIDLAKAIFVNLGLEENIKFRDTPEDIRDKYQYFTEADMEKLINAGFDKPFLTLEEGIANYVGYLKEGKYF